MRLGQRFGNGHGGQDRPADRAAREDRWLHRQVRGFLPDRNPLRRRTDRLETFALAGLFVAAAAGGPFAVQWAAHAAASNAAHVRQEQVASRQQVKAVLTVSAAAATSGYTLTAEVPVMATWTSPTGVHKSGEVLAEAGSPKGSTVTVWSADDGTLTTAPLTPAQVAGQADAATVGASVGVVVAFLGVAGSVHHLLHRRRLAAWEADWLVTSQTWNHQSW